MVVHSVVSSLQGPQIRAPRRSQASGGGISGEALSDKVRTRIPTRAVHPAGVVPAFTSGSGSLMWPASRG